MNPFTGYIYRQITVIPEEKIIRIIRKHWSVLLKRIIFFCIWFLAPFFFMYPLFQQGQWGVLVFVGLIGSSLIFLLYTILLWYWNFAIITTRRIIDVEKSGILQKTVSELLHSQVIDISYSKKGIAGLLWNRGVVVVVPSGEKIELRFEDVKSPQELHSLLLDFVRESEHEEGEADGHDVGGRQELMQEFFEEERDA